LDFDSTKAMVWLFYRLSYTSFLDANGHNNQINNFVLSQNKTKISQNTTI